MLLGYYLFCYILFCYAYNLVTVLRLSLYFIICQSYALCKFLKSLLYFLTRISLLMGHFSVRNTAAFSLYFSCSTSSQSYIVRSIACSSCLHERVGLSMILYLCMI